MTTPDIEQLAKECAGVIGLHGHEIIQDYIERAIAPLQQENERLHAFIDQASRVGYGTAVTLAIEKEQQRAESELAELRGKVNGALVNLQGGDDIELAARKMVETNRANQQGVIRLSDELAELRKDKERLDWLDSGNWKAERFQDSIWFTRTEGKWDAKTVPTIREAIGAAMKGNP